MRSLGARTTHCRRNIVLVSHVVCNFISPHKFNWKEAPYSTALQVVSFANSFFCSMHMLPDDFLSFSEAMTKRNGIFSRGIQCWLTTRGGQTTRFILFRKCLYFLWTSALQVLNDLIRGGVGSKKRQLQFSVLCAHLPLVQGHQEIPSAMHWNKHFVSMICSPVHPWTFRFWRDCVKIPLTHWQILILCTKLVIFLWNHEVNGKLKISAFDKYRSLLSCHFCWVDETLGNIPHTKRTDHTALMTLSHHAAYTPVHEKVYAIRVNAALHGMLSSLLCSHMCTSPGPSGIVQFPCMCL